MHVSTEIGFWSKPVVRRLAVAFRNELAGSYLLRLRELALTEAPDGVFEGRYQAEDLAAYVGSTVRPRRFVQIMLRAGALASKPLRLAEWQSTDNGRYLEAREYARERKKAWRAAQVAAEASPAAAGNESVPGTERGQDGDTTVTSQGRNGSLSVYPSVRLSPGRRAQARPAAGPPEAPPRGVTEMGPDPGWEWFAATYPRMRDARLCRRLWDALEQEDRDYIRAVLPLQVHSPHWKNKRFQPHARKYLQEQIWLEVKKPVAPKPVPKPKPPTKREEEQARLDALAMDFYVDLVKELRRRGVAADVARIKATGAGETARSKLARGATVADLVAEIAGKVAPEGKEPS